MDRGARALGAILEGAETVGARIDRACTWLDENLRTDPPLARELVDALLPEAAAAGDVAGEAWLRFYLAWLSIDADDYERGLAIVETARAAFENLGDHAGLSRCLNALGTIGNALGLYDLALDYYRESAAEAEASERRDLAGVAKGNMAECLYELGELEEALLTLEHCRREYAIAPHNVTADHTQAGLIYKALGRLEEAERELREGIRTAGGAAHDSLEARQALAEVHLDAGRLGQAQTLIAVGLEECARTGERMLGTRFRLSRARLARARQEDREAISDLEAAIRTAQELGTRKLEADGEKALYQAWEACGDYPKALAAFARHVRLKEDMRSEQISRRVLLLHDERARREAHHFQTLYHQISTVSEIGQRITANLDLDATLEALYASLNGLMDAPTLLIARVDEERQALDYRLVIIQGVRKEPFSYPLGEETFACWCARHRTDIVIGDLEKEYGRYVSSYDHLLFEGVPERSMVFVPLLAEDKVAGVLSVQSHKLHAYDKRKVEVIRAIGAYLAIAIENSRLFEQIQRLATLDGLTGILNRRRLTETLEDAYFKTRRYRHTTGIILVDLDFFKQVNDTHGHGAGDLVLRTVARTFTAGVRACDTVGRLGGEEFMVLLPETDLAGAHILAERLREAVEALEIPLPGGGVLRVSASFGVSIIGPDDPDHEAVLRRADRALYRSKAEGRNRVSVEEGT